MATFDQLSAEQRAIIELVLQRGKTYDELAELLHMPESRVRELAQDALIHLSPITARRVEDEWQGQLADYVLGQQSGPESTATRGHLRRSEAARAWARSLLDSLDTLYENGMPTIPDGDRGIRERRLREPRGGPVLAPDLEPMQPRAELSPEARQALRRRRMLAAGGAAAVLVALIVLVWPVGVLTGDDEGDDGTAERAGAGDAKLAGRFLLRPVEGGQGAGIAVVAARGKERSLIVQARLKRNAQREAYEVWLYHSDGDARSIGAQVTDARGNYQGAGPLPANYKRYKFIDISREKIDQNARHSGVSVLRGSLRSAASGGGTGN